MHALYFYVSISTANLKCIAYTFQRYDQDPKIKKNVSRDTDHAHEGIVCHPKKLTTQHDTTW